MKRIFMIFFMIFLFAPIVFADISITTDQQIYNLGNKIKASASLMQGNNFEGLFRLTLSCGTEISQSFSALENSNEYSRNYKLQYFLTPVSLEAKFRTAVSVPELVVAPSMLGNCTIAGDLVTNDNLVIEEKESNSFSVTSQLTVLPVKSQVIALPSESIKITGIVNEAFGNNVLKALIKIGLENGSHIVDAVDGKFNLTLEVPKNIKSGKHTIGISASDQKNNVGSSSIEIEITAIPSYLKTELSSNKLLPGSKIEVTASIYDQADDFINDTLDLELASPKGDNVFKKSVQSSEKTDYEFSQHAEPGLYILTSTYKNLLTQDFINISTIREVKLKYENETVFIENIGNIPFEDELTFFIESEAKKYPITKKINIEPGKIIDIDLSKEVPSGIYNIILPLKEGLGPIKEKINETIQGAIQTTQEGLSSLLPDNTDVLASDVIIHDNRPIYKRIVSGLGAISGSLVGANGLLAKNPIIAPMIIIIILLLIIVRYGRKPITRLIKRKKEGNKKDDEV